MTLPQRFELLDVAYFGGVPELYKFDQRSGLLQRPHIIHEHAAAQHSSDALTNANFTGALL